MKGKEATREVTVDQNNFEKLFWERVLNNVKNYPAESVNFIATAVRNPRATLKGLIQYIKENPKEFAKNITMVIPLYESIVLENSAYRLAGDPHVSNKEKLEALNKSADLFSESALAILTTYSSAKVAQKVFTYLRKSRASKIMQEAKTAGEVKKVEPSKPAGIKTATKGVKQGVKLFLDSQEIGQKFSDPVEILKYLDVPSGEKMGYLLKKCATPDLERVISTSKYGPVRKAVLDYFYQPLDIVTESKIKQTAAEIAKIVADNKLDPLMARNVARSTIIEIHDVMESFVTFVSKSEKNLKEITAGGEKVLEKQALKMYKERIEKKALRVARDETPVQSFTRHEVINSLLPAYVSFDWLNDEVSKLLKVKRVIIQNVHHKAP